MIADFGWTDMERGALQNFLAGEGPLRNAMIKFIAFHTFQMKSSCALHMATAPRNYEIASDYAAKAQLLDEFWELLADAVGHVHADVPASEPPPA